MKRLLCGLLVFIELFVLSASVAAQALTSPGGLILSEVKIRNTSAAQSDEFVEIYNPTSATLSLKDYQLEYFNTSDPVSQAATVHQAPFILTDVTLAPTGFVVLAIKPASIPGSLQLPKITALKDDTGTLRLIHGSTVVDSLSWKKGAATAGVVSVPSQTAHSLQRLADGQGLTDWQPSAATPLALTQLEQVPLPPPVEAEELPEPEAEIPVEPQPEEQPVPEIPVAGRLLQITELLPNPMMPQTDAQDEFVEIFNPTSEAVDLAGYSIQTGSTYSHTYKIPEAMLLPGAYRVFTSGETKLALSNSAGGARLLAPDGNTVYEVQHYVQASEGQAWALVSGGWQWTTTPTPGADNALAAPVSKEEAKAAKATAAKPKAATKAASTTKKAAAAAKPKAADSPSPTSGQNEESATSNSSFHTWVVAGIGVLAVAYAAYEYRQDIAARIYQLRRYRTARREARAKA